ncbi:MAG: ABC transporter ATP-binding protein [Bacteroidia bacterium]|nr:ABC transporter ATP-binding protein [Bacteroidia bacterium]
MILSDFMELKVRNITVCNNKINIVENLSFSIKTGDVLGLIGPNGCGKSTLMKAMIGSLSKSGDSNLVVLNSEIVKDKDDLTFGFVPEDPILYDYMTIVKNFLVTSVSKGIYDNLDEIYKIISILKLDHLSTRKARSLSQGEKKRLSIGLALIGNPDVLILDEPHNGLDNDGISILRTIIKAKSKDHIIILCSHYFSEIEAHCNQILALNKGEIFINDTMSSVLMQYHSIEKLFNSLIRNPNNEKNLKF